MKTFHIIRKSKVLSLMALIFSMDSEDITMIFCIYTPWWNGILSGYNFFFKYFKLGIFLYGSLY